MNIILMNNDKGDVALLALDEKRRLEKFSFKQKAAVGVLRYADGTDFDLPNPVPKELFRSLLNNKQALVAHYPDEDISGEPDEEYFIPIEVIATEE